MVQHSPIRPQFNGYLNGWGGLNISNGTQKHVIAAAYRNKCPSMPADAVFLSPRRADWAHAPRSANNLASNATHIRYLGVSFSLTLGLGCFISGDYLNRLIIANISSGD